jgi:ATP-dependent DNA helicase DinG
VLAGLTDEKLNDLKDGALRTAERAGLQRRAETFEAEAAFVFERAVTDARFVVFVDGGRRASVTAAPIDAGDALAGTLFRNEAPVVMTSATLAVAGSMRLFKSRTGVFNKKKQAGGEEEVVVEEATYPSPFDHARRSALYCPAGMPEPQDASWSERFDDEVCSLLELTMGGALLLFTSTKAMQEAHGRLAAFATALGCPVFRQGDAPKNQLLKDLRAHDGETGAVLFATQSFWEGVDVQGRALRLVVVDKLPFKVPVDPLQKARAELCKQRGGDPFRDIALPEAALSLKQGTGRLLRSVDDAGIVAVLDGRLRSRSYGNLFMQTLPPMTKIGARAPLAEFWKRFVNPTLFKN